MNVASLVAIELPAPASQPEMAAPPGTPVPLSLQPAFPTGRGGLPQPTECFMQLFSLTVALLDLGNFASAGPLDITFYRGLLLSAMLSYISGYIGEGLFETLMRGSLSSWKAMNKKNETELICDMIVLGVHMSGVIGCDAETRRIPPSAVGQYFATEKARMAIRSCIEKAKDNPLRLSRNRQIQVQVTPKIGRAIQTGELELVLGLKEFLEEISEETDTVTVIGRSASEDEVLPIRVKAKVG